MAYKIRSKRREDGAGQGERECDGGSMRVGGLVGDWRSLRLLTDVPPGPLKGLLTHFDYSGPVVTENITSIRTIKWTALFFSSLPHVVAPFTFRSPSHCPGLA